MSVTVQTGNSVTVQSGNRVLISAPGPQGAAGAAGASEWGDIGGTLSNQTDLQSALDAKLDTAGDGSGLTGITATQVGAITDGDTLTVGLTFQPSGGLKILDTGFDHTLAINLSENLTADKGLNIFVNDGSRTISLFGNLTISSASTISGTNSGDVTLVKPGSSFLSIANQVITQTEVNLASHVTSTLPVANGGTGATTLSANAVLLGNGTSAVQTVAPSTSGNVLTSNGTTWTSAAPATTNPAGSGSELQFRSSGTAFGAVTSSSVSGANVTLGGNLSLLGTGLQYLAPSGATGPQYSVTGSTTNGFRVASDRVDFWVGGAVVCDFQAATINVSSSQINFGANARLFGNSDGTGRLVQRNGTSAQTFSIANTWTSFTNKEEFEIGWVGNSNVCKLRPIKGSGGGTSRTAEYHTTETGVKWTSGTGTPEGAVTAPVGSLFTRTDGGASTTLYVKESGAGNTGWVAK